MDKRTAFKHVLTAEARTKIKPATMRILLLGAELGDFSSVDMVNYYEGMCAHSAQQALVSNCGKGVIDFVGYRKKGRTREKLHRLSKKGEELAMQMFSVSTC